MPEDHALIMLATIEENPWLYLDEISAYLHSECGVDYGRVRCFRELVRRGYSLKVMQQVAQQRDEEKRNMYRWTLLSLGVQPWNLLFCDETSKRDSVLRRKRGWGLRGHAVRSHRVLHRETNISVLALFGLSGFVDFSCKEGGYTSETFLEAFEFMIVPHLEPGHVLVMDNCQIHHTHMDRMRDMAVARGAIIVLLAPYSPIDNPIEYAFSVFKAFWRRHSDWLSTMDTYDAVRLCLFSCYENAAAGAQATFTHCGYT
jgi:hypothetical protein